ncbi:ArdC family protein [Bacteroides acidifaciens]|uniref:ArdC family protein n=1 Tax=Bacteroides acidifaciens TaxID=85831 RepID=UPI0026368381|nr:zincin-like metallopeptidase domain-containing protein [Bacteroides acidifaciens]
MAKSVYEMVTERIISQLQNGIIPWQKPWTGIRSGAYNRISKKPYSLLNQMLLSHEGEYATFKQWQDLGGHVRKGEKAEIVVFWKIQPVEEILEDGTKEVKQIPLLRYFNVFHISQVDGVEPLSKDELNDIEPIEKAESILHDYWNREGIEIEHIASDNAYYSPSRDLIHLPLMEQFKDANEYYSTAFHESVHSTMKETRCNRAEDRKGKLVAFGSNEYSKEELVAEIGSANLMNILGIESDKSFRNSTAYIQGWLSKLRNDVKFIVSASGKAEKAVKYILGEA